MLILRRGVRFKLFSRKKTGIQRAAIVLVGRRSSDKLPVITRLDYFDWVPPRFLLKGVIRTVSSHGRLRLNSS